MHDSIYVEDSLMLLKILEYRSAVRNNELKPTVSHNFDSLKHLVSLM